MKHLTLLLWATMLWAGPVSTAEHQVQMKNQGTDRSTGELLPGWNLSFGGILLDAKFIKRDDRNFGKSPKDAADWQLGLYTSYELQGGPLFQPANKPPACIASRTSRNPIFAARPDLAPYERIEVLKELWRRNSPWVTQRVDSKTIRQNIETYSHVLRSREGR